MNLEQAVAIAPFMQDFYDKTITVVISSPQSVIVAINHEKFNLGVHKDEPTNEKTITFRCLKEKKRQVKRVPIEKSQFGISYIAIANPLWNNGQLVGAMTVVIFNKRYDALKFHVSIEAARAGEKFRSFAMVAAEVGKLSESAKRSALVISEDIIEVNVSEQFN